MTAREERRQLEATENKTYSYMFSATSSFLTTFVLWFAYWFFTGLDEYLLYHNDPDDHGGKLHYVDLNALCICGIIGLLFLAVTFFAVRAWVRRIRRLEKKLPTAVASCILFIVTLPISAIFSLYVIEEIMRLLNGY